MGELRQGLLERWQITGRGQGCESLDKAWLLHRQVIQDIDKERLLVGVVAIEGLLRGDARLRQNGLDAGADWRLRSFTPTGVEVWGAGHNALGAWWWLAEAGRLTLSGPRTVFQQEIGERVLPVEVLAEEGKEGEQWRPTAIGMTQTTPIFGAIHTDAAALAAALALETVDLAVEGFPVQVVSTGVAHLLVPVRGREAVERAQPEARSLYKQLRSVDAQGCYLFSLDPVDPAAAAYTRFFNPTVGIVEDPATGSAAGPLTCYLARYGRIVSPTTVTIEQGYVQGRPSRIEVRLDGDEVRVFGAGVTVAEGVLFYATP